jgi:choline kinase
MAQSMPLWTFSANGLQWCEVDFPADLKQAQRVVRSFSRHKPDKVDSHFKYAFG